MKTKWLFIPSPIFNGHIMPYGICAVDAALGKGLEIKFH